MGKRLSAFGISLRNYLTKLCKYEYYWEHIKEQIKTYETIKMKNLIKLSLLLVLIFPIASSLSDTNRRSPSDDGVFTAGPYYNSATQSYYELIRIGAKTYAEAEIEAALYKHNDTPGQLATISRPETHMFIVRNFVFTENTWIGLKFGCEDSSLTWSDGKSHAGNNFSNWSPDARNSGSMCVADEYLPAFINANAFDWSLDTTAGFAELILVEYPTGGR